MGIMDHPKSLFFFIFFIIKSRVVRLCRAHVTRDLGSQPGHSHRLKEMDRVHVRGRIVVEVSRGDC